MSTFLKERRFTSLSTKDNKRIEGEAKYEKWLMAKALSTEEDVVRRASTLLVFPW